MNAKTCVRPAGKERERERLKRIVSKAFDLSHQSQICHLTNWLFAATVEHDRTGTVESLICKTFILISMLCLLILRFTRSQRLMGTALKEIVVASSASTRRLQTLYLQCIEHLVGLIITLI